MKFKKIIAAFDGSEDSVKAVQVACKLAKELGADLVVVHSYAVPTMAYAGVPGMPMTNMTDIEEFSKQQGQSILTKGVTVAKDSGVAAKSKLLESHSTVQALVDFAAEEEADLVVVGTRGMTGFKKLVMGSVSSGLVGHAHCPVLVVR